MDFGDFIELPELIRRKHIQDRRWFMGIENPGVERIIWGEAVFDYLENFLNFNTNNIPQELKNFDDNVWNYSCVDCNNVFRGHYEEKLFSVDKSLIPIINLYDISSGICPSCFCEIKEHKKFKEIPLYY